MLFGRLSAGLSIIFFFLFSLPRNFSLLYPTAPELLHGPRPATAPNLPKTPSRGKRDLEAIGNCLSSLPSSSVSWLATLIPFSD